MHPHSSRRLRSAALPPFYTRDLRNTIPNTTEINSDIFNASQHSRDFQRRWMTLLPLGKWPQDAYTKESTIFYCYRNQESYNNLYQIFEKALDIWFSMLGFPSVRNGHSLVVMHIGGERATSNPLCYTTNAAGEEIWNPLVPWDTLVVIQVHHGGMNAAAVPGYLSGDKPGRHFIQIDIDDSPDVLYRSRTLAHELGQCSNTQIIRPSY